MSWQSTIEHELFRFRSMTPKQLLTRLYKITHVDKLDAYIEVANRLGYFQLAEAAIIKRNGMRTGVSYDTNPYPVNSRINTKTISVTNTITRSVTQNEIIKKKEVKITQEIEYKRALDF